MVMQVQTRRVLWAIGILSAVALLLSFSGSTDSSSQDMSTEGEKQNDCKNEPCNCPVAKEETWVEIRRKALKSTPSDRAKKDIFEFSSSECHLENGKTIENLAVVHAQKPHGYHILLETKGDNSDRFRYFPNGVYAKEADVVSVLDYAIDKRCNMDDPSKSAIVVDIGANFGIFALQSAAQGCQTFAYEPQTRIFCILDWSIGLNMYQRHAMVEHAALSDADGESVSMEGAGGLAWVSKQTKARPEDAVTMRFDTVFHGLGNRGQMIRFVKIDVEGHELQVMDGMRKSIEDRFIEHIVVEFGSADRWHRCDKSEKDASNMLSFILKSGYSARFLAVPSGMKGKWKASWKTAKLESKNGSFEFAIFTEKDIPDVLRVAQKEDIYLWFVSPSAQ
eukprot:TRINITY_DN81060_c0_g1_i1.p1 TRINITY_DN81060_c0_g1~~TRINITY_DN81060_c0_g1_i1.p1  ORF type:complete len:392 (-),score=104.73 TRINITY_DN81060_c0_g1_i1:84-1259(-)